LADSSEKMKQCSPGKPEEKLVFTTVTIPGSTVKKLSRDIAATSGPTRVTVVPVRAARLEERAPVVEEKNVSSVSTSKATAEEAGGAIVAAGALL